MANLTKSSGVSPPFNHKRSSPPSPVPPTIGAGVVSATVVGVAAAASDAGVAAAAVVGVAAALVALLLLLLSSPQATIAIVKAANPAATLIILILLPLGLLTGCSPGGCDRLLAGSVNQCAEALFVQTMPSSLRRTSAAAPTSTPSSPSELKRTVVCWPTVGNVRLRIVSIAAARKRSSSRSIGPDRTISERLSAPTRVASTMPR